MQAIFVPFGERHVDVVQLFHVDLENLISECMDRMYELAKTSEEDQHKMALAVFENRT